MALSHGNVGTTGLPTTKYLSNVPSSGYQPAPLDEVSLINGAGKFLHPQIELTEEEQAVALEYLDRLFPLIHLHSRELNDDEVYAICLDADHADKASGYPWNFLGQPTKRQAVITYGIDGLRDYYKNATSVIGSTLKSELRPVGKDARFFRPQDVSSFIEALTLFYDQNEHILSSTHRTPVFCHFVTPGTDIIRLFARLAAFGGSCFGADGHRWDANFPLSVANVIASWRIRHGADEARTKRYYEMMYNGYTNVGGHILHLVGQPSGHFNTSVDNSLAHCIMFAIHAHRNNLNLVEMMKNVLFYCCGDDLIWSDRTGAFYPEALSCTYKSLGMYLEFESLAHKNVYDLSFVGVEFFKRSVFGRHYRLYAIRGDHAQASFNLRKKSATDLDELAKYCSLCQMVFANKPLYELFKRLIEEFVVDRTRSGTICMTDRRVSGLLGSIQESVCLQAYLSNEGLFSFVCS